MSAYTIFQLFPFLLEYQGALGIPKGGHLEGGGGGKTTKPWKIHIIMLAIKMATKMMEASLIYCSHYDYRVGEYNEDSRSRERKVFEKKPIH